MHPGRAETHDPVFLACVAAQTRLHARAREISGVIRAMALVGAEILQAVPLR